MSDLPHSHGPATSAQAAPCPVFARHLSDLIEGACSLEHAAWLERHAGACRECSRALALALALRRTLGALGRQEPSARYRLALTAALGQRLPHTARSPRRAWRRHLSMGVLLAVLVTGIWACAAWQWARPDLVLLSARPERASR